MLTHIRQHTLCFLATLVVSGAASLHAAPIVFQASGNLASATAARDAFRAQVGGGVVAGPGGSFGGIRREINWDGVPDGASAPNPFPGNFFQNRGTLFTTPGTGFATSADGSNPTATPIDYANIDPSYGSTFAAFSAERLFTSLGSNVMDVQIVVPSTNVPSFTNSFGVVFSDVDFANTTSIEYFDQNNASLGVYFAPAAQGNETFSFLGVFFDAGERVSRVRITSGNAALGAGVVDGSAIDVVVMDDFLFGEAAAIPEPGTWMLALAGLAGVVWLRRKL